MNHLNLNISNLKLNLVLRGVEKDISIKLVEMFSPFVIEDGNPPHETLNVFRLREDCKPDIPPELESLIKKSLELPLRKFPFSEVPERRIRTHLDSLNKFLKDSRYLSFFDDLKKPEDVVMYPFNNACLVRRQNPVRTAIFLKNKIFFNEIFESIREAVYFTISTALPLVGGVLLHGVGIRRNGSGYLFLGDSGAGKSTIARFSRPEEIVSDDGVIIERKDKKYRLQASPINQRPGYGGKLNENEFSDIKLHKGFFIIKGKRDYIERVSAPEACSIILKNHIHYFRYFPLESVKMSLSIVSNICRKVPFFTLHFNKDCSFWALIVGGKLNQSENGGE